MSLIKVGEIEVGCRGQRITIRGIESPLSGKTYPCEAQMELSLQQAREVYRLLGKLIPVAEKSTLAAPVIAVSSQEAS